MDLTLYRRVSLIVLLAVHQGGCGQPAESSRKITEADRSAGPRPSVVQGKPIAGSGKLLNIVSQFHDQAGQTNIAELFIVINEPARGVDGTRGCAIWCKRLTGDVLLLDDAGKGWLGPQKLGSNQVLVNSQCLVSLKNTGLTEENGNLLWVTSVGFSEHFHGTKNIYAKAVNRQEHESAFALLGSWTATEH